MVTSNPTSDTKECQQKFTGKGLKIKRETLKKKKSLQAGGMQPKVQNKSVLETWKELAYIEKISAQVSI
jgi:hypothetical protein